MKALFAALSSGCDSQSGYALSFQAPGLISFYDVFMFTMLFCFGQNIIIHLIFFSVLHSTLHALLQKTQGKQRFRQKVIPIKPSPHDSAPPGNKLMWKVKEHSGEIYEYAKIFPRPELVYIFSSYKSGVLIDYHYVSLLFFICLFVVS